MGVPKLQYNAIFIWSQKISWLLYFCPGVPIFVKHWVGYFAILPQFCPIFNIGGMNLDHDFVQVSKLSEDPKKEKGLHQKSNTFFY